MDLNEIRTRIDEVDDSLINLFRERMELSREVALYKEQHDLPILNKAREREVMLRVSRLAGDEMGAYARLLFSSLFEMSRSYQQRLMTKGGALTKMLQAAQMPVDATFPVSGVVACQGVEGAYSQLACDKIFSASDIMYFRTFEGVFQAVQSGLCEYGVLPIENSSSGSVNGVYDLLHKFDFSIVRSVRLHVNHFLMAKPGTKLSDIKEICSHEYALDQCSNLFDQFPGVKVTAAKNTAIAAQTVAQSDRTDLACISSPDCAKLYNLNILKEGVQNNANNYTRFICIKREPAIYPGANKISLMLSVPHKPGSLYSMISKFSVLGLNLTKLESRPIWSSAFEFLFYLDLEASVWTPAVMELLEDFSQTNPHFAFLGSYSEIY